MPGGVGVGLRVWTGQDVGSGWVVWLGDKAVGSCFEGELWARLKDQAERLSWGVGLAVGSGWRVGLRGQVVGSGCGLGLWGRDGDRDWIKL